MLGFSCVVAPPLQLCPWLFHEHQPIEHTAFSWLNSLYVSLSLHHGCILDLVSIPFSGSSSFSSWLGSLNGSHSLLCLSLLLDPVTSTWRDRPRVLRPLLALSSMSLREGPKPLLLPGREIFFSLQVLLHPVLSVAGMSEPWSEQGWPKVPLGDLNFQMALGKCPDAHLHPKGGDIVSESSRVFGICRK